MMVKLMITKSMGTSVTIAVHPEWMVVKHVGVFLYLLNLILITLLK